MLRHTPLTPPTNNSYRITKAHRRNIPKPLLPRTTTPAQRQAACSPTTTTKRPAAKTTTAARTHTSSKDRATVLLHRKDNTVSHSRACTTSRVRRRRACISSSRRAVRVEGCLRDCARVWRAVVVWIVCFRVIEREEGGIMGGKELVQGGQLLWWFPSLRANLTYGSA